MPGHELVYGGVNESIGAQVAAMKFWDPVNALNKGQITIFNHCSEEYRSGFYSDLYSGIDRFLATVYHEAKHVEQIRSADFLVPRATAGAQWKNGWSWNFRPHNHWTESGEPLEMPLKVDWPKAWPLPFPDLGPTPIESEAVNYADGIHDENKEARRDWGHPGKNHQTLDRWDD